MNDNQENTALNGQKGVIRTSEDKTEMYSLKQKSMAVTRTGPSTSK